MRIIIEAFEGKYVVQVRDLHTASCMSKNACFERPSYKTGIRRGMQRQVKLSTK